MAPAYLARGQEPPAADGRTQPEKPNHSRFKDKLRRRWVLILLIPFLGIFLYRTTLVFHTYTYILSFPTRSSPIRIEIIQLCQTASSQNLDPWRLDIFTGKSAGQRPQMKPKTKPPFCQTLIVRTGFQTRILLLASVIGFQLVSRLLAK